MATALVACFAPVAKVCAKPLMDALKIFFTELFQSLTPNNGQSAPADPTNNGQLNTGQCAAVDPTNNDQLNTGLVAPVDPTTTGQISGAKLFLVENLKIHDPNNKHSWKRFPGDTRFKETEVLARGSQSWEIKASIKFDSLSAYKTYGVYLIFKTTQDPAGLDAVLTATVTVDMMTYSKDICIKPEEDADEMSRPEKSSYDDWKELELGEFLCSNTAAKRVAEISIKVKESGKHNLRGLIVAGIEVRYITY